jgi:hypothetical protein
VKWEERVSAVGSEEGFGMKKSSSDPFDFFSFSFSILSFFFFIIFSVNLFVYHNSSYQKLFRKT